MSAKKSKKPSGSKTHEETKPLKDSVRLIIIKK